MLLNAKTLFSQCNAQAGLNFCYLQTHQKLNIYYVDEHRMLPVAYCICSLALAYDGHILKTDVCFPLIPLIECLAILRAVCQLCYS